MHKVFISEDKRGYIHRLGLLRAHSLGPDVSYKQFVESLFKEMGDPVLTLHHATTGIAGEGGEILDCSKKSWVYGTELDVDNLLEEMGDLLYYFTHILNMTGLTMRDIENINIEKLLKRYPEGRFTQLHAELRLDKVEPDQTSGGHVLGGLESKPSEKPGSSGVENSFEN